MQASMRTTRKKDLKKGRKKKSGSGGKGSKKGSSSKTKKDSKKRRILQKANSSVGKGEKKNPKRRLLLLLFLLLMNQRKLERAKCQPCPRTMPKIVLFGEILGCMKCFQIKSTDVPIAGASGGDANHARNPDFVERMPNTFERHNRTMPVQPKSLKKQVGQPRGQRER